MGASAHSQALKLLKRIGKWLDALEKVDCDRTSHAARWSMATVDLSVELDSLRGEIAKTLTPLVKSVGGLEVRIRLILEDIMGIKDSLHELCDVGLYNQDATRHLGEQTKHMRER